MVEMSGHVLNQKHLVSERKLFSKWSLWTGSSGTPRGLATTAHSRVLPQTAGSGTLGGGHSSLCFNKPSRWLRSIGIGCFLKE